VDVQPVGKFAWQALILRMKIPTSCKVVAFALSHFANEDGSRVFPGQQKVADMAVLHETNARRHIRTLLASGMLQVVKQGGGRGGATTSYRLSRPTDITTLPLWLDPTMDRVAEEAGSDPEYRALALGETESEPVDNSETPSTGALHLEDRGGETPSDSCRNTERFVQKHRALALPDQTKTTPTPNQPPAGLSEATTSLTETITADSKTIEMSNGYKDARKTIDPLPHLHREHLLQLAATELAEETGTKPVTRDIVIRAADLATRPQTGTP
jgi:hypothetical protein